MQPNDVNVHARKDQQNKSSYLLTIAKAAQDQPETQKYNNPTLTQQTVFQTTIPQVDVRSSQHLSTEANTLYNKAGKCSQTDVLK